MHISRISIQNFRSIGEAQEFDLPKIGGAKCFVLLGMNESGKTSTLKAIALLSDTSISDYSSNCFHAAEERDESIQLWFKLETDEPDALRSKLIEAGLDADLAQTMIFDRVWRGINIHRKGRSDYHYIFVPAAVSKILGKYLIVENKIVPLNAGHVKLSEDGKITNALTEDFFRTFVTGILHPHLLEEAPKAVVWQSTPEYRIVDRINLENFKERPSSSIPLRNCFRIAGFETDAAIKDRITAALGSPSKTASLSQILSEKVTAHITSVWSEHKVRVQFHIDSSMLSFLVEDQDNDMPKFEVEQRSDGFKHFISILLNISAESRTNSLKNKIILLDEPETHLHPSGQRYLRDELLEIARNNNTVIFATHSIFMVDTKHLDRHFSVKKKNGSTEIAAIEKDNPYQEEVLFEALGTSALQLIEPNVLIVEGKTDRDIFRLYCRKCSKSLKPPKVTSISADSVDSIVKYTKFLNTKLVKGFVLVDSDPDGKREKEKILKEPGYSKKNTFEINDVLDTKKDSTLEDLFNKSYATKIVAEMYGMAIELEEGKPFMAQIKAKLAAAHKPFREAEKEKFKQAFFEQISSLSKKDLEAEPYFEFVQQLCKSLT